MVLSMPANPVDETPTELLARFLFQLGEDLKTLGHSRFFNLRASADCHRLASLLTPFLVDDGEANPQAAAQEPTDA
jgi:hypothetical protein